MDEQAERAKLELLDLTEDVIELILEKKRSQWAIRRTKYNDTGPSLSEDIIPDPIEQGGTLKELADIEEPTFYLPSPALGSNFQPIDKVIISQPVEAECSAVPLRQPLIDSAPHYVDQKIGQNSENKYLKRCLPWQRIK